MRKLVVLGIFLILFLNVISAHDHIELNYEIIGNKVLVEVHVQNMSNLEYNLPVDYSLLELNTEDYVIEDKFLVVDNAIDLEFSYVTKSLIEETSHRNLFILQRLFSDQVDIHLALPEGGYFDDLIVPEADLITSEGKIISLHWNNFEGEEIVVSYTQLSKFNWGYSIALALLIILFVIYFVYSSIKFKKKLKKVSKQKKVRRSPTAIKKEVTRNLYGEEKKIVEYLMDRKGKESWTKEMVRDLDISKVRLSRKLRSLVQRGLIEKVPYGNENRIRLLKKR